jgi:hypothetical protein
MGNPLHSEYCNCECPAGNSYAKLEETLNRVRRLHYAEKSNYYAGELFCDHCSEWNGNDKLVPYPCDTMKALQGDDE